MSGRARARARGQLRSPSPGEVGPLQVEAPGPSTNLHEQQSEGAPTTDPQGGPGPALRAGEGLVEGAGGRKLRRHSLDLAVHTRERLAHVRDSKAGCSGVPVKLVANFFSLELPQDWQLFQYHVTFHPDVESRRLRTALLYGHSQLSSRAKAFDGVILFLSQELEEKVTELSSVTQRGETVQMTLTLTRQLPASSPVCMQVFNLIFRKILRKLSLYQIGRNFYNPSQPVEIPQHKLSLWPGFAISVSQFENSLLLHADVCYKILRNETVLELMAELCHRDDGPCFTQACEEQLIGLVVLTRYNNRTYRVDDIDWSVKPTHTFQKRDGTRLSYMEYYKQQYDITVSDLGQPMLVSQLRHKGSAEVRLVHLLPELCFLTEVAAVHVRMQGRSCTASEEDAQAPICLIHVQKGATQGDVCGLHNLMVLASHPQKTVQGLSSRAGSDFPLMKAVAEEMRLGPMGRQQRLAQLADDIQRNKDTRFELETWGLHLGCQLSVTGRVVPTEKMILQDRICQPASAADWSKDVQMCKLLSTKSLNNWLILCSDRIECVTESFLGCLRRAGSSMGFNIQHPKIIKIQENPAAFLRAIQRHFDPNIQLVMCILPSNNKSYYDSIKKYLSSDCPVPSQCVRARTLHRPGMLMSVATKVALQLTCKLGGELWAVEIPLKSLMVVGIALCKDAFSTGMMVVGFVASMNPGITRWFSRCILQRTMTEVADCLKAFMSGALNKWYEANHILPARIIVYRSGVGDGQLQTLIDYELPQLLSSVTASGSQARYDFYLVSQAAHRGTVSPTYYNVIYDDNGLKPDHMQRLTFKLCHLYYNWPGLVRMPAPCQYAHKLTFLVAQSIHKEPSLELANSLFYL